VSEASTPGANMMVQIRSHSTLPMMIIGDLKLEGIMNTMRSIPLLQLG
jgi:hypothetical protein